MQSSTADQRAKIQGWFAGRLPDGWFTAPPKVTFDNEEILVVGALPQPDVGADAAEETRSAAESSRIERFRADTRDQRMRIAQDAQALFRRKVSWGAACGEIVELFTTASVPVMTRLRIGERAVLDTLIDAGVARSRSEALAWCVRLVGRNESEWIAGLRSAFEHVESVRAQGPKSTQETKETKGTKEG
ncbi:MAG TPA: hypothetical protein VKQ71_02220 [Acidimicrobiales bacterium]|nr:hypothetical protein [Acidimicrobiales bacterium]